MYYSKEKIASAFQFKAIIFHDTNGSHIEYFFETINEPLNFISKHNKTKKIISYQQLKTNKDGFFMISNKTN